MTDETETVRFEMYGASDDLIESEGVPGCDEFNVPNTVEKYVGPVATFMLSGPGGSLRIMAFYDGVWYFGIAQSAEGLPIPPWPLTITHVTHRHQAPGYSTLLKIDVPKGTVLARLAP